LIGHEGENSLLSYLKEHDLADTIETDIDHWADCVTLFTIDIKLTKNALDKTDDVVEGLF
jgi:secreted Zn-dependent insulinase-like peptidase